MGITKDFLTKITQSSFTATKVKVKDENAFRFIKQGESYSGKTFMYGSRLVVGELVTSRVLNVEETEQGFMVETRNSVYSLERS